METKKSVKHKIKQMLENERRLNNIISMTDGDRTEYFRLKDEHTTFMKNHEFFVNQILLEEQTKSKSKPIRRSKFFQF